MKQKNFLKRISFAAAALFAFLFPVIAHAHEVYVLSPSQIAADQSDHSVDLLSALSPHNILVLIIGSAVVGAALLLCLWLRTKRPLKQLGALTDRASVIAPDIIRVTFGLSLIFSATHHAVFGPELPLSGFPLSDLLYWILLVTGVCITLGLATRIFGIVSLLLWIFVFIDKGIYVLTYANYLGEAVAIILLNTQLVSLDHLLHKKKPNHSQRVDRSAYWAMPVARILFGAALLYAAINVKILHTALSLDVVNTFHLTRYFPFDPLFVVLGATLTELLLAALYMLGLLQRVTSVVFIVFITLSLLFFKEAVWPHYLLLGLAAGIFLHRPDRLSLDKRFSTTR